MKTIVVDVTQEDIDKGDAGRNDRCPIARALRRVGFSDARVYYESWSVNGGDLGHPLTRSARTFVSRFDHLMPVKPARFRLRVPS